MISEPRQETQQPHPSEYPEFQNTLQNEFRVLVIDIYPQHCFSKQRLSVHFQKQTKKLEKAPIRVVGSDGVNPGELRGGGEA